MSQGELTLPKYTPIEDTCPALVGKVIRLAMYLSYGWGLQKFFDKEGINDHKC